MDKILKVVGIVWTLIGVTYLADLDTEGSDAILGFGILLGMMVYVLPGLVVAGIGFGISKRSAASTAGGRHSAVTEPSRKCPYCAETIKLEAKVCRYCGRDLPDSQEVRLAREPERAAQETAAQGEWAATNRRMVIGAPQATPEAPPKAKRDGSGLLIAVLVGFAVLLLAWGVFHETRSPSREREQAAEVQEQERAEEAAAEAARLAAMSPAERAAEEKRQADAAAEMKKRREEEAELAQRNMLRSQGLIWNYEDYRDELSGKIVSTAWVKSDNTVVFDSPYDGPQRATLTLRSHPRHGNDAVLEIERGQFVCGYDDCFVNVAFDDGKVQNFSANEAADHRSTVLFIANYARFIKQLRAAKEVRLAATVYQEGSPTFRFKVEDLKWDSLPVAAPPPKPVRSASVKTPPSTQGKGTRITQPENHASHHAGEAGGVTSAATAPAAAGTDPAGSGPGPAQAQTRCMHPQTPYSIPDGATAPKEDMLAGQAAVQTYASSVQGTYLPCLEMEMNDSIAKLDAADEAYAQKKLALEEIRAKKHNAALDDLQAVADRWKQEITEFKVRH